MRIPLAIAFCSATILCSFCVLLCFGAAPNEKVFAKALDLMEGKSYAQAIKNLETLITKSQSSEMKSISRYLVATCYRRSGNWNKAISYYKLAVGDSGFPFADIAKLHIATGYKELQNCTLAIEWYEAILRDHPVSLCAMEARFQLGECHFKLKQYDMAIQHYAKLVESYPEGNRARISVYKIGEALQGLGKWSEAYAQYRDVISQNMKDSSAQSAVVKIKTLVASHHEITITREDRMNLALVLYYSEIYKFAREELKKLVDGTDDLSAKAAYLIADSYYQEGKYTTAAAEYNSFAKRYPKSDYAVNSQYQVALCHLRLGKEYRSLLAKFAAAYPKSDLADDAEFKIAEYYMGRGQYKQAIDAFSKVVEKYPTGSLADQALWNIGWYSLKLKDNNGSEQAFRQLIIGYPGSPSVGPARFWLGVSCERSGKWQASFDAYKESMRCADWYYSGRSKKRAEMLVKNGKIPQEAASFQYERVKIDDSVPAWRNIEDPIPARTRELLDMRIFDDVITEFSTAIETGASLESAYYNLSACYARMGDYNRAWGYAFKLSLLPGIKGENGAMPRQVYRILYPIAYRDAVFKYSAENNLDPLMVLAVIFEESRYNPVARSRAGALGLMQIMPRTGGEIARGLSIPRFGTAMLHQPETNIKMGTWHLSGLVCRFNDHVNTLFSAKKTQELDPDCSDIARILALGAYNGGEGRVRRWTEKYNLEDIEEFVEDMPLYETKQYIKKVCDSYEVYKSLYNEK